VTPLPHDITQVAQNEGTRANIRVYKKGRKCPKCHYPLSIYTEGPYCRAHGEYERELEERLADKKREAVVKKNAKLWGERRAGK